LKLKLIAYNLDLYYSWKKYFDGLENIEVIDDDIFSQKGDAIVSPANSFGYMDGGLDLKISQTLGWDIERKVREVLEREYFGELPVGNAIIVETSHQKFPYLISAPTMRVPSNVSATVNAYLAFKAIIQAVLRFNRTHSYQIETVLCPGLGTGEGKLSANDCARQMYMAYETCMGGKMLKTGGLSSAVKQHMQLLGETV